MKRVLKKDGIMIHGCPSVWWCFWTLLTGLIKRWYIDPRSHSIFSNNVFTEIINSREKYWKRYFQTKGLKTINVINPKLFILAILYLILKFLFKKEINYQKYLVLLQCFMFYKKFKSKLKINFKPFIKIYY